MEAKEHPRNIEFELQAKQPEAVRIGGLEAPFIHTEQRLPYDDDMTDEEQLAITGAAVVYAVGTFILLALIFIILYIFQ